MAIPIRSPEELDRAHAAGRAAWRILDRLLGACIPGVRTGDIDALARECITSEGATPLLLGAPGPASSGAAPFPGVVCVSVNEEAIHGVPGARQLRAGDIVKIDLALSLGGWCADVARARVLGGAEDSPARRVARAAVGVTQAAVEAIAPGRQWSDVRAAALDRARELDVRLAIGFAGHGIGRALHEPPTLTLGGRASGPGGDLVLRPGMILTVEPIVTLGGNTLVTAEDGWTVVTEDRRMSACEERTVGVTRTGPRVLTGP